MEKLESVSATAGIKRFLLPAQAKMHHGQAGSARPRPLP